MDFARVRSLLDSLLPWLVALSMVWLVSCARPPSELPPRAVQGVLDARAHGFAQEGPLSLEGEWAFYWQKDLTPDDFAHGRAPRAMYVELAPWTQLAPNGKSLPRDGYATYHLRVLLPPDVPVLAFCEAPRGEGGAGAVIVLLRSAVGA